MTFCSVWGCASDKCGDKRPIGRKVYIELDNICHQLTGKLLNAWGYEVEAKANCRK